MVRAGGDLPQHLHAVLLEQLLPGSYGEHVVRMRPQPAKGILPVDNKRAAGLFEDAANFGDAFAFLLNAKEKI